jgi:hypothetical protein
MSPLASDTNSILTLILLLSAKSSLGGASYKAFSSSFRLTAGPNVMVLV